MDAASMNHMGDEMRPPEVTNLKQLKQLKQEHWLGHFCGDDEVVSIIQWMLAEGLQRPELFAERLRHASYLKTLGNDQFGKGDYRRALHCALAAVHTLDFSPEQQMAQSEAEKKQVTEAMSPVLTNLTMIFLKRGDYANAVKAADAGMKAVRKLPLEESASLRAKLLYRRGLARGETGPSHDLERAYSDLVDAAKLEPANHEIRHCLENCKALLKKERSAARLAADDINRDEDGESCQKSGPAHASIEETAEGISDSAELHRRELTATEELLAKCVGRSLGKCRRRCRTASGYLGSRAGFSRLLAVALFMPVLSFIAPKVFAQTPPPQATSGAGAHAR